MATKEDIEKIAYLLNDARPTGFFQKIDETTLGIGAVLRLLYESNGALTAGAISQFMNVSTARVAVLLKKMVAKGLIKKEQGREDARTIVVSLTEVGQKTISKMREDVYRDIGTLIDTIGMERLIEYTRISKEICSVMKGPPADIDIIGEE